MEIIRATALAQHDCGHMLSFPISDLESPATCPGCGQQDSLEPRHIAAAREGYARAIGEVEQMEGDGEQGRVLVTVEADATGTGQVH